MDFGEPFGGVVPGARGAALSVLLRTGTPLTGRRVHALIGERHSLGAVQQALRDLERLGLITTETVGRAGVHQINEKHEAIAPLRMLVSPIEMLTRVIRTAAPDVEAVIMFGSIARDEASADSDIDLAVIASQDWDGRAVLEEQVRVRLGNACDVLHLTPDDLVRAPEEREPVVAEILRDGVALIGRKPRGARRGSFMTSTESRNYAKRYLQKAEEYLASAEDNLDLERATPAAGDAIHAGISAKDAIVTALTGATVKARDHAKAAAELRRALGVRPEAQTAERALRELVTAKADVEYGNALVTLAKAGPLVRRARTLVDLATQVVRHGR